MCKVLPVYMFCNHLCFTFTAESLHVLLLYFILGFDNCNMCNYYIEVLRDKDEFNLLV